jgi:transcriptional regulator with XRE-family HTH domain
MNDKRLKLAVGENVGRALARPGVALRGIRMQRGWTLADVSERTGLPVSTLSKLENDRVSLSYDKLARLSAGLGVDISQFFSPIVVGTPGPVLGGRRSFTPAGQGQRIETENYDHRYLAADCLNKRFVPLIAELRARTMEEFGELIRHSGEEFTIVLEGSVEFHCELYAPQLMRKGDSIFFDSAMGHAYLAAEPGPCRVLSICSGPESQLIEATQRASKTGKPARKSKRA